LISTVPAGEFLFSVPFGRVLTLPLIRTQDSFVRDFAVVKIVPFFVVVIVWTVLVRSRTSMKISLPCSRIVSTQPLISTSLFVSFGRSLIRVLCMIRYVCFSL